MSMAGFGSSSKPGAKKNVRKKHLGVQVDLLFQEALRFQKNGDLRNAEDAYQKIIKSGCLHSEVFLNLGDICQKTGRLRRAISLYEQSVSLSPDLFDAHMKLGTLSKEIGDLDRARREIMRALLIEPSSTHALLGVMSVYDLDDIPRLKSRALDLIGQNRDSVGDLDFVEFVASLGAEFCQYIFRDPDDSVAFREV